MIKDNKVENELAELMSQNLNDSQNSANLFIQAVEALNEAALLFEDIGLNKEAQFVTNLMKKVSNV